MDDVITSDGGDPRDEIVRLEARIEVLADKIESCRKFILAARIAIYGGGILFVVMLLGVIRFDPAAMTAAVAALLGGFVVWGSNSSTANEARAQSAAAEARRNALIEAIELRTVGDRAAKNSPVILN
jgi:hypothetical protein